MGSVCRGRCAVDKVSWVLGGAGLSCLPSIHLCHAGRDLVNMAKQRPNVIPIIEDARHPAKYRMLVPMVDVVFADVAQPDQASSCSKCGSHTPFGSYIVWSDRTGIL